jgi:type VI secretion system protein VasI
VGVSTRVATTTPTLILRCQEKKTNAFIGFDFYLGIGEVEVTTRLDKEKAKTTTWNASSDHQAVFAPNAVGFVRELAKHSSLFVRLTPYGESPVSTSFDLRGIVEAVKPLQAACGWK